MKNLIQAWMDWKHQRPSWVPQNAIERHNRLARRAQKATDDAGERTRCVIKRPQTYIKILSGETDRPSSAKVRQLGLLMDLSQEEARHLEVLAAIERSNTPEQLRESYFRKISDRLTQPLSPSESALASEWYVPVIQMLSRQPDFEPTAAWIRPRLRHPVSADDIEGALALLDDLDLMGNDRRLGTEIEAHGEVFYEYNEKVLALGQEVLAERDNEHVFINGLMAVPASRLPELKRKIHEAMEALALKEDQLPADITEPRIVYQAGIMIFPLTKPPS